MKRAILFIISLVILSAVQAQRISHNFQNVTMSDALQLLNKMNHRYTINFIYNDLEDFRVTTNIKNKNIPDAIRQLIGFYPISMMQPTDSILSVECYQKTDLRYKGRILDEYNKPAEFANIALLSPVDSSVITTGVSNESGYFVIPCEQQKVIIRITYVGYKTIKRIINKPEIGIIKLQPESRTIKGVTVNGDRIAHNANGYGMSFSGTGLENCNTVNEAFAFLPGITVTNHKIELFGHEPIIYVNGIKVISQDELASIQPQRIDKISVEYLSIGEGVAQKGGVIHITTKKERNGGFSGYLRENVTEMGSYGHVGDMPSLSFNASMGEWTLNYYAMYNHQKLLEDATNRYKYADGMQVNSTSKTRSWMNNFSNRLNISYELGKRSTIAVSEYIGNKDIKNKQTSVVERLLGNEGTKQEETIHGPESKFTQQTVGKYIMETDDKGSNIEITADYLYQNYHIRQMTDIASALISESKTYEATNMYRVSPKYTKRFAKGYELKAGADYQYIHYTDETSGLENVMNGQRPSAYVNFSGRKKMLMYAAGLTWQYDKMDITTEGYKTTVEQNYLCPQANLMWMINPKKRTSLALMYQRGVDNMPYSVINAYKNYSTPDHYTTGNPELRTPSDHQLMLRFSLDRHISLTMMFDQVKDAIYYDHGVDENNVTWSKPENADYERAIGAILEATYNITKWWMSKVQASAIHRRFVSPKETINGQACGKFRWNNNFNFTPTFGGTLSGYWETGTSFENYSWRPVGHLETSLWKTLCRNKLRLALESVICARGRKTTTWSNGYTSYYHNATKPTSFDFTVTWNFSGGKKVKLRQEAESIQQYHKIEERK